MKEHASSLHRMMAKLRTDVLQPTRIVRALDCSHQCYKFDQILSPPMEKSFWESLLNFKDWNSLKVRSCRNVKMMAFDTGDNLVVATFRGWGFGDGEFQ